MKGNKAWKGGRTFLLHKSESQHLLIFFCKEYIVAAAFNDGFDKIPVLTRGSEKVRLKLGHILKEGLIEPFDRIYVCYTSQFYGHFQSSPLPRERNTK